MCHVNDSENIVLIKPQQLDINKTEDSIKSLHIVTDGVEMLFITIVMHQPHTGMLKT